MFLSKLKMSRIEESISKLKRFKYHAIGRLELEDAIDDVVSWYEQNPKVMQEVSDNVDKLRAISTPAEEDWFKVAEEWEKEDKK